MMTREQWQAMTPQQQFDYVLLLEDTVDRIAMDDGDTQPVTPIPKYIVDTLVDAGIEP